MSTFFRKINEHKNKVETKLEGHGLDPFDGIVKEKKTRNNYKGDVNEAKKAKQKSKNNWAKKEENKETVKNANKKEQTKRAKKIRYLYEKYHKEIGLQVKKFTILDENTGKVTDEYIIELLDLIRNSENKS